MKSETINELATALASAQGQMEAASRDAVNPHLKNRYATLSSIIEAARKPLSDNGLSFAQILSTGADGMVLETILMHSSGQWLQSEVFVDSEQMGNRGVNSLQALGSALTYYKRYALAAMIGASIAEDDDDGNDAPKSRHQRASQNGKPEQKTNGKPAPQKPRVDEEKPYKFPSNAAETFWKQVQGSTENYYKNPFHLVEVLGGQWFNFGDQDLWGQKLDYAISHAQESWETQQAESENS